MSNLGPQVSYPIPEGIINHHGENYLAITLWSLDQKGAKIHDLSLAYDAAIYSGYSKPKLVAAAKYNKRSGSY